MSGDKFVKGNKQNQNSLYKILKELTKNYKKKLDKYSHLNFFQKFHGRNKCKKIKDVYIENFKTLKKFKKTLDVETPTLTNEKNIVKMAILPKAI